MRRRSHSNATTCGPPNALSVTVCTDPVREPMPVGEKELTESEQLAAAASDAPQVFVSPKSPLALIDAIVKRAGAAVHQRDRLRRADRAHYLRIKLQAAGGERRHRTASRSGQRHHLRGTAHVIRDGQLSAAGARGHRRTDHRDGASGIRRNAGRARVGLREISRRGNVAEDRRARCRHSSPSPSGSRSDCQSLATRIAN